MGVFHVDCRIENYRDRKKSLLMKGLLVDTGSEFSWVPAARLKTIGVRIEKKDESFLMANGALVYRAVGFAIIRLGDRFTIDEIVFAEPGDLALLGARTLEGLNLTIDPARKKLVAAGPLPAAAGIKQSF